MTLLAEIKRVLDTAEIPFALIGGVAVGAYNRSRMTLDLDLFAVEERALMRRLWASLQESGVDVECRWGDIMDPLRGIVALNQDGPRPVDLVVGASPGWQNPILDRAQAQLHQVEGVEIPVVTLPDLILLKLYAGGPRDRQDITELLERGGDAARSKVDTRVLDLPQDAQALWRRLRDEA